MIRSALHILEKSLDLNCLPAYLNWLPSAAPTFSLHGDQVSVLHKPEEFYNTLIERCCTAKRRIALASLYLGTGALEKKLIQTLDKQLREETGLEVSILLDANRGSRGKLNSRTMLLPLLHNYPQCQVSLFHTPSLRGPLRFILPPRYNELVGLQHMKLYLFDDSVIISGANLSEDYFTNRQDRYVVISDCKDLADFYWGLIKRVSDISLALDDSDNLKPRSNHPFKTAKHAYVTEARQKIWGYYTSFVDPKKPSKPGHDTWVFPLVELPPLDVHQDSETTVRLLESIPDGARATLSTGYFNLTRTYTDTIISRSMADFRILMAHPSANGFLRASGLAGGIPGAYTGLARVFLAGVEGRGMEDRVSMMEWRRQGWTFHVKGLWAPNLTLVGSSNFGERSVTRDLETQVALVTNNRRLMEQLKEEEEALVGQSEPFTLQVASEPERRPALWVLTTMWLFKNFF